MAGNVCDGLSFAKPTEQYITNTLDPILEEMIADVIQAMPEDIHDFMIQWLRKRSGLSVGHCRMSIAQTNVKLKEELTRTHGMISEMTAQVGSSSGGDVKREAEEEEEEEDDDCDELPPDFLKSEASMSKVRSSVSAEAYGEWNQKKAFEPPKYPKTQEQKTRLSQTLQKSFMFDGIDPVDMETIILAMKECPFDPSTKVIEEGESGDFLFVIEKGTLECYKQINGESKVVKTCSEGDVFGELALLYNCPRAADVVAKDSCICWQLDRDTFNSIVKDAAVKRREKYDAFLKSVTLLSTIDAYERSQIADALVAETFRSGEIIVKQDEPGNKFYIVESGTLYALKDSERVKDYKAGDYFGELALLKNQPRAASVVVSSDTARVLCMSRVSFTKMLGPLADVLASRVNTYI
jgi:cAMP-dependent protein kinase regulator